MKSCISTIRYLVVLMGVLLLQCALALYEDLGHKCTDTEPISVRHRQPSITYTATPFPLVTNGSIVTLICAGRTKDFSSNPSFMEKIEFKRNNNKFHQCFKSFSKIRYFSCNVTVTDVTNDDRFLCIIRASKAPCNVALIGFEITSAAAPKISSLANALQYDATKVDVTCVGTGAPRPVVLWLLNGSLVNEANNESSIQVHTTLEIDENVTRAYHVKSRLVITGQQYPLRIQCVARNDVGELHSENIYVYYGTVLSVKLTTVSLRWTMSSDVNGSFLSVPGYNISLTSGNESYPITRLYNKTTVTFSNLTMGRTYTASIQALTKKADLVIGVVDFYSPDQLPKPSHIKLVEITSRKAVIGWENIPANRTTHGILLGYKVELTGNNRRSNFSLKSDQKDFRIPNLMPSSKYTFTIRGFTQYGDGKMLQYNFSTLDVIPAPQNVKVTKILKNSAIIQWSIIDQSVEKYDKVKKYKVIVRNETSFVYNASTSNDNLELSDLLPNTKYNASVMGISNTGEGIPSEWISFKTIGQNENSPLTSGKNGTNWTMIIVILAVVLAVLLVAVILIFLRMRRQAKKKRQNIKPNKIVMNNVNGAFDANLRILYPEYYNDDDVPIELEELPRWEVRRSRLAVLDNILGGGYFGLVKEGIFLKSDTSDDENQKIPVAVKTLKANRAQGDWNELLREFEILKYVNENGHPNIINLVGACTQTVPILLVMEFCSKGNLKDILTKSRIKTDDDNDYKNIYSKLNERQLITFAAEIAKGMNFLFGKKVVHRDIASRNILLNDAFVPKIADFGLARKVDSTAHYIVNKNRMLPVKWMSIESLEEGRFIPASDTWSYGVLLWEICTLAEEPYPDVSPYDIVDYIHEGHRLARPDHCSIEIFTLMERCWQEIPEERPSFQEIVNGLEAMLTDEKRSYVNVRPYYEVNDLIIAKSDIFESDSGEESGSEITAVTLQDSPQDSGIFDTSF